MKLRHAIYEPGGPGPHPTLIAFHGWGASALDLLGLAPYLCDGNFLTICPQGPLTVPLGPTSGYGWFPLRPGSPPDDAAVIAAVAEAVGFVDEACQRYPIDPQKLVVLGFSQGGIIATGVAISKPQKFAAVVGVSTWFPEALKQMLPAGADLTRLPILVQHGRGDTVIEIGQARDSVERLRAMQVDLRYREYDCGHEITAQGLHDISEFLIEKVLSPITASAAAAPASALDAIAPTAPALIRAETLGLRSREAGFDWRDLHQVIAKIREELEEVEAAVAAGDRSAAADELGDAMLALANAPRFVERAAEATLAAACDKFERRFRYLERTARDRKLELKALDDGQLDALWNEAKSALAGRR
ncbi:MAG TPA: alpha/beta fold hydrolase [Candidatus Binataceae bacterium]|nr:alpha/beta fold hydrolase [Candidatus Binataceae bacterium]